MARGPAEITGIFTTRRQLETAVGTMHEAGMMPKQIAAEVQISSSTLHDILKKYRENKRAQTERENRELINKPWR